jgi:hypothetical protein
MNWIEKFKAGKDEFSRGFILTPARGFIEKLEKEEDGLKSAAGEI